MPLFSVFVRALNDVVIFYHVSFYFIQDFDYFAIDDLTVEPGQCPPPPVTDSCDAQSQSPFSCDAGVCFDNSKQCDKNADCLDMTDESTCNWGVDCDFNSDDCVSSGYTPRNRGPYFWRYDSNGELQYC